MTECKRGDIYMAVLDADRHGESVQEGTRPVLVVSNDQCNAHSPVITAVPFTSRRRKRRLPTHVLVWGCGLAGPSVALAEQIMTLNKGRLKRRMGSIRETVYQTKVDQAIKIQLSVH